MPGKGECRNCGEPIVWLKTRADKNIAVDPESLRDGEDPETTIYNKQVHLCHWNACGAKTYEENQKTEVVGFPDARKGEEPF